MYTKWSFTLNGEILLKMGIYSGFSKVTKYEKSNWNWKHGGLYCGVEWVKLLEISFLLQIELKKVAQNIKRYDSKYTCLYFLVPLDTTIQTNIKQSMKNGEKLSIVMQSIYFLQEYVKMYVTRFTKIINQKF